MTKTISDELDLYVFTRILSDDIWSAVQKWQIKKRGIWQETGLDGRQPIPKMKTNIGNEAVNDDVERQKY